MFSESARYYDLIYEAFKDYSTEAHVVAGLIRHHVPGAETVLDVGCGTGEHARHLGETHGFAVDGIDIEPHFVALAQQKNPSGSFHRADMRDFDLQKRYHAVLCLFSSIGYVQSLEGLGRALACFSAHVDETGVVIVEPWFAPGDMQSGYIHLTSSERDGLHVCRMSHTRVEGRRSILTFEYLVGEKDGITRRREVHELGLFTCGEMLEAFASAGLDAAYDPEGPTGRGLYVARPRA